MWLMMDILDCEGVEVKPETAKPKKKKKKEFMNMTRFFWMWLHYGFFFFLATLYGMWDLSSPTRDQTQAHGSESSES